MKLNNNIIMPRENISLYIKCMHQKSIITCISLSSKISLINKINSNWLRIYGIFFKTILVNN